MLRFIYLFSLLWCLIIQSAQGELTSGEPAQEVGTNQNFYCHNINKKFKTHIQKVVKDSYTQFLESYECINGKRQSRLCGEKNEALLNSVSKYRSLIRKYRLNLFRRWAKDFQPQIMITHCLGEVKSTDFLKDNSRVLNAKNNTSCQPLITNWSHTLSKYEADSLKSNKPISGMPPEEVIFIKEFKNSPVGMNMSEQLLSAHSASRIQDKNEITKRLNDITFKSKKLFDHIDSLKDHQLHQLFIFQSQFSTFANSFGAQKSNVLNCMSSSSIAQDCLRFITYIRESFSNQRTYTSNYRRKRCGARKHDLLVDLFPVVNIIDAISESKLNFGAVVSGAATREEYTQRQASLFVQGALGVISLLPPASLAANTAARATGNIISATIAKQMARSQARAASRKVAQTVTAGETVSQLHLHRSFTQTQHVSPPSLFIKDQATVAYRIPDDAKGLSDIPAAIRSQLGKVDDVTGYTDDYIIRNRGNHIVLQVTKDGKPDFYISGNSRANYDAVSFKPADSRALEQVKSFVGEEVPLGAIRKKQTTEMIRASDLGVDPRKELTIESPWGGTQTKPAGVDAWIVRNGDEVYMVNIETSTGLPVGYARP